MDERLLKKNARIRGSGSRNVQSSQLNIEVNKDNSEQPKTTRLLQTNNRINKKDARIRGSGARNIKSIDSLNINPSMENNNKRLVSQLSSAMIHDEDLELTRSKRRKSSILPYRIIDKPPPRRSKKRVSFKEPSPQPSPSPEPDLPDINDFEPSLGTIDSSSSSSSPQQALDDLLVSIAKRAVGRPKKQKSLRGRKPKNITMDKEQQEGMEFVEKVKQRINKESSIIGNDDNKNNSDEGGDLNDIVSKRGKRRRRNESSLLDSPSSERSELGLIELSNKSNKSKMRKSKISVKNALKSLNSPRTSRRPIIPTPSPEPESDSLDEDSDENEQEGDGNRDPDYGTTDGIRVRHSVHGTNIPSSSTATTRRRAIPLLNNKRNKISIDYPTLINASNNRGRVQRAKMLDVLRSLISSFEPPHTTNTATTTLKMHEVFKNNLLSNIDKLRDAATTVEDIAKNIRSVKRAKKELRMMILELRKNHTEIGNQMNQLRNDMKDKKQESESLGLLTNQLNNVKQSINNDDNESSGGLDNGSTGLNNQVQLKLFSLQKILNPSTGLQPKLRHINNKLEQLNDAT